MAKSLETRLERLESQYQSGDAPDLVETLNKAQKNCERMAGMSIDQLKELANDDRDESLQQLALHRLTETLEGAEVDHYRNILLSLHRTRLAEVREQWGGHADQSPEYRLLEILIHKLEGNVHAA